MKRPEGCFSCISESESRDIVRIAQIIEGTLKKAFNYKKMNYLMLMMVDLQVHYHVIPRYDQKIQFAENIWIDHDWPKPPTFSGEISGKDILSKIVLRLKEISID